MNVTLNEWNDLIEYGNEICDTLNKKGYNVKLNIYKMYDGRKGLSLDVFDKSGKFYRDYCTGIYSYNIMKENLYISMKKIIEEC